MDTIIIKVGASSDYYGAYAINCEGIYGAGETAELAKENALEGLKLFVESRPKETLPKILQGDYTVTYQYDTQSFLNHYSKIFSKPALQRLIGINQKLLHHYSSGLKKPRLIQRKRIETALHRFGKELLSVEL